MAHLRSPPAAISTASSPATRIDFDGSGFQITRRVVLVACTYRLEQPVSNAGSLTQPRPHRLDDGTIVLTYAEQVTSDVDTDSYLVHLDGTDAPLL